MRVPGTPRHDVTLNLSGELCSALDEYAQQMATREPGIKPSRSAAARQLLARALEQVG